MYVRTLGQNVTQTKAPKTSGPKDRTSNWTKSKCESREEINEIMFMFIDSIFSKLFLIVRMKKVLYGDAPCPWYILIIMIQVIYIYSDQSCDGVDDFDPFDSC